MVGQLSEPEVAFGPKNVLVDASLDISKGVK
jgi:hypothetical protein